MRLIDADELECKVRWFGGNTAGLIPQYELRNVSTIEAIPVEWMVHYVGNCDNFDKIKRIKNYNDVVRYLLKMYYEWEKENENR